MPKARHTKEQRRAIVEKVANGTDIVDVCKSHEIGISTYYLWKNQLNSEKETKAKDSALKSNHANRTREAESENDTLKRMYVELAIENDALKALVAKLS